MVITDKPATTEYAVIGSRPIRHDGLDKVTGRALYGADIRMTGLVYGAVVRSPHAHARIKSIDTSRAEALPGVLAVMTAADMPLAQSEMVDLGEQDVNFKFASNRVMAGDKVNYKGHPVAAVAAMDHNTALEAAKLVTVEYEVLKHVRNVREAMAPDAPVIHEDLVGDHLGQKVKGTNVSRHVQIEFGDPESAFSSASAIIEHEYELSTVHQGYIEPHTGTAHWNKENRLTVWTSTQGAFGVRRQLAGVLRLPESRIKVIPLEIGGGFGGKINVYLEPLAAILSRKCGRPVKFMMDRKTVFEASGPAAAGLVKIKMGVDEHGGITAATADIRYEAGAYPGSPIAAAVKCVFAAYNIPNTRIDAFDVIVNKPKTAAYRAPGSTHVAFAVESVIDEMREKLGIDPLEFRRLNATKEGDRRADGPIFSRIGNIEVIDAARKSDHWNSKLERVGPNGRLRGRGLAIGFWGNGGGESSVSISFNRDGTFMLVEGSTDIGGTRASIAMQAAEVLGVPAEDVRPYVADTEGVGYTGVTGGSRTTYATGLAAYRAASAVVEELKRRAAIIWDLDAQEVQFAKGVFSSSSDPELRMTIKEIAGKLAGTGGPVGGAGTVDLEEAGGGFGLHIVDLEVDPETGKTDVLRYTAIQDAGTAVHPSYVEGQMQGGAAQGIGWALNEEYFLDDNNVMMNSSFLDYRMPTSLDLPMIETIIVEVPNPLHPYGVRGVGETPIAPPVGAIANALYDALGTRLRKAPMKPASLLEAMASRRNGRRNGA